MVRGEQCKGCKHLEFAEKDLWCYMFREEPKTECMQHSKYDEERKKVKLGTIPFIVMQQELSICDIFDSNLMKMIQKETRKQ